MCNTKKERGKQTDWPRGREEDQEYRSHYLFISKNKVTIYNIRNYCLLLPKNCIVLATTLKAIHAGITSIG